VKKKNKTQYHIHHIIPRHAGGTDDPSNLIRLTIPQHAEAHRVLFEQHGHLGDELAWKMLAGQTNEGERLRIELLRRPQTPEVKRKRRARSIQLKGFRLEIREYVKAFYAIPENRHDEIKSRQFLKILLGVCKMSNTRITLAQLKKIHDMESR